VLREHPLDGTFGIGHTRWATHGRPTEENAHPHRDCTGRIVVVHNGIVENYLDLKRELIAQGHKFVTETDTEIIAHLIEQVQLDAEAAGAAIPLEVAVRRAVKRLTGAFALGVLSAAEPDKIVAARFGPPVVIGVGEGESFVASDVPGILHHTRNIYFLADGDMAILTLAGVELTDFDGNPIERAITRILWDPIQAEKGGYKHFMLKEIWEQPRAITDTTLGRVSLDSGKVFLGEMKIRRRDWPPLQHQHRRLRHQLARRAHRQVHDRAAGAPARRCGLRQRIPLSQSHRRPQRAGPAHHPIRRDRRHAGRAARDDRARLEDRGHLQRGGRHGGPRGARRHLYPRRPGDRRRLHQGLHRAAHRAVSAGAQAGPTARPLDAEQSVALIEELSRIPGKIEEVLRSAHRAVRAAGQGILNARDFLYLGRGIHFPIALEGALKLKEISYIHAEGYPAGEMKHGPNALIDETLPVVVLATRDESDPASKLRYEKTLSNIQEVTARSGRVIAVATEGDTTIGSLVEHVIHIPPAIELLSPLIEIVPLQLLAYYIAVRRGCDVDQPRNLAKSVTVE
jgi:glutamine---fructose-6-phosphate transaminase (isomerizing)